MSTETETKYHNMDLDMWLFIDTLDRLIIRVAKPGYSTDLTLSKENFKRLRNFCKQWDENNNNDNNH